VRRTALEGRGRTEPADRCQHAERRRGDGRVCAVRRRDGQHSAGKLRHVRAVRVAALAAGERSQALQQVAGQRRARMRVCKRFEPAELVDRAQRLLGCG
jgi:hypothetical protein